MVPEEDVSFLFEVGSKALAFVSYEQFDVQLSLRVRLRHLML